MSTPEAVTSFQALELPANLLRALSDVGYETPSAIQAATIPALRAGRDVLGQAQTGTGKTAAFALPILEGLLRQGVVRQAKAIDVAEAVVLLQGALGFRRAEARQGAAAWLERRGGTRSPR